MPVTQIRPDCLPKLTHFNRLFDKNGILQHSHFSQPDPSYGYSIDDNARALVILGFLSKIGNPVKYQAKVVTVIRFIESQKSGEGEFFNYLLLRRGKILRQEEAGDGLGQVIWACGYHNYLFPRHPLFLRLQKIIDYSLPALERKTSLRLASYALGGLVYQAMADQEKNKAYFTLIENIANRLTGLYEHYRTADWRWFENWLVYGNAILPWSLLLAGNIFPKKDYQKIGLTTLDFLISETTLGRLPVPIGQGNWYEKGKKRSVYDQQPIEAGYMVLACLLAARLTDQEKYLIVANLWQDWFHGQNLESLTLIDEADGGCYDGLQPGKVNQNKGAESMLCYLLARLSLYAYRKKIRRW